MNSVSVIYRFNRLKNLTSIIATNKKNRNATQKQIFHNAELCGGLPKNTREITKIILEIKIIGNHLIILSLLNFLIIITDWYLSEILETISRLSGIMMAVITPSKVAISVKNLTAGVKLSRKFSILSK
jgi:hypothetical protein